MKVTERMMGAFMDAAFKYGPFPGEEGFKRGVAAALAAVEVTPEMVEVFGQAWRAANTELTEREEKGEPDLPSGYRRRAGLEAVFRADV